MTTWQPAAEQKQQFQDDGYFTLRNVIPQDVAIELRGVIKNTILMLEPDAAADADPMGDSPDARAARFRKLSRFCATSPLIWHNIHAGEALYTHSLRLDNG